ncbi:MAG: hypothetical protein K2W94_09240 [Alphaproteobacteria bacterium]|nr:hypothetical protein [Alphaproteobacteria bacterium]
MRLLFLFVFVLMQNISPVFCVDEIDDNKKKSHSGILPAPRAQYLSIATILEKENARYFFAEVKHAPYSHALVLELHNTNGNKSYLTAFPIELLQKGTEIEQIKIYLFKRTMPLKEKNDTKMVKLKTLLSQRYPKAKISFDLWRNK